MPTILTVSNPGLYVASDHIWNTVGIVALIGVVLAAISFVMIVPPHTGPGRVKAKNSSLLFLGFLASGAVYGMIIGLLAGSFVTVASESGTKGTKAGYAVSVGEWLDADYDIQASSDEVNGLAFGETLGVDIDGKLTVVHIVPAAGGDIALVDSGDTTIEAR